ncbi:dTDP-4-amino-4,6-dideoxygalactose transaminase [Cyclobacteriaceae bacterium]|nr:dTDP-4-amino-4,6-dideoxygalactose transaminase [Cyclobacteriaceae bacterium]
MIPFNKPYTTPDALTYISQATQQGKLSGNGTFNQKCCTLLKEYLDCSEVLLTPSCTHALEMCALLLDIQPGDEVILPSYAFVSLANAFELRGAKLVFVDVEEGIPNISLRKIEKAINKRTRAILFIHYAGVSADLTALKSISDQYQITLIEDAAHALGASFQNKKLGTFGHLATFSFHETKNIQCGEGGALIINDEQYLSQAHIIWEKGTNRVDFFDKKVNKYEWLSLGSSYLLSELSAAYLYSQLLCLEEINHSRMLKWRRYDEKLILGAKVKRVINHYDHNAHMFSLVFESSGLAEEFVSYAVKNDFLAVTHYEPLHLSTYWLSKSAKESLPNTERISKTLVRLPLYRDLTKDEQNYIINCVNKFCQ